MNNFTAIRLCAISCALAFIISTEDQYVAAQVAVSSQTIRRDCVDLLATPDELTILVKNRGPAVWKHDTSGSLEFHAKRFPGRKKKNFHRIFRDPDNEGSCLSVATIGADHTGGLIVYRTSPTGQTSVFESSETVHPATYYQSQSGDVFVASRRGTVYRIKSEGFSKQDLKTPVGASTSSLFREIRFAESPEGIVVLYSMTTNDPKRKQLSDLLVADEKDPDLRRIDMKGRPIGASCFAAENSLLVFSGDDLLEVDVNAGEFTSTNVPHPKVDDRTLEAEQIWRMADNSIIGLFRHQYRSRWSYDVEEFDDGYFHQLAELRDGQWNLLNIGKDRQLYQKQIVFTDQETGVWFSDSGAGLLNRSPTGNWRRFDFRDGIRTGQIDQMVSDSNGYACLADSNRNLVQRINLSDLQNENSDSDSGWSLVYSRVKLTLDPKGIASLVSLDNGGEILRYDASDVNRIPLPAPDRFSATGPLQLSIDSAGNHWLFAERDNAVAVHHQDRWQLYPGDAKASNAAVEQALEDVLDGKFGAVEELEDFHIGNDLDKYKISFTADRQIVYLNSAKRICYFDGHRWYSPASGQELRNRSVNAHPFFHRGQVVWAGSYGNAYKMPGDQWKEMKHHNSNRPWEEIEMLVPRQRSWRSVPHLDKRLNQTSKDKFAKKGACGNDFVFGENKVSVRDTTDVWKDVPCDASPLYGAPDLESAYLDASGRLFLELRTPWIYRYAVYEPKPLGVKYKQTRIDLSSPFAMVTPEWSSEKPKDALIIRFRVGDRDWSKWLPANKPLNPGGFRGRGPQILTLQVADKSELMVSSPIEIPIRVEYDLTEHVEPLLSRLGSESFGEREEATEKLLGVGSEILPELRALVIQSDVETALRAKQIVDALESRRGSDWRK